MLRKVFYGFLVLALVLSSLPAVASPGVRQSMGIPDAQHVQAVSPTPPPPLYSPDMLPGPFPQGPGPGTWPDVHPAETPTPAVPRPRLRYTLVASSSVAARSRMPSWS